MLSKSQNHVVMLKKRIASFENTPLQPVSELLLNEIASMSDTGEVEIPKNALDEINRVLDRLPKDFTDRFYFDAFLIQSLTQLWAQGRIKFSGMIIPNYKEIWAHETMDLPFTPTSGLSIEKSPHHRIDIIYFRRNYEDESPDLLSYPWLIHEIGHYIIYWHGKDLFAQLSSVAIEAVKVLQLRAIADQGVARMIAKEVINEINRMWNPSLSQSYWSHELAVDTIALWAIGPAYINAFFNDHKDATPFKLEPTHPPVIIRTYALIEVAKKLKWNKYLQPLTQLFDAWETELSSMDYNKYVTFRDRSLIDQYLDVMINYCIMLGLPRLKVQDIDRLLNSNIDVDGPTLTSDLIVNAWLVSQQGNESIYEKWEDNIIKLIMEDVKQ